MSKLENVFFSFSLPLPLSSSSLMLLHSIIMKILRLMLRKYKILLGGDRMKWTELFVKLLKAFSNFFLCARVFAMASNLCRLAFTQNDDKFLIGSICYAHASVDFLSLFLSSFNFREDCGQIHWFFIFSCWISVNNCVEDVKPKNIIQKKNAPRVSWFPIIQMKFHDDETF